MEQSISTSKVTVEYHDPDGMHKLLAPGLVPRFPLRDLHWRSDSGGLRSIPTLHVDLLPAGTDFAAVMSPPNPSSPYIQQRSGSREDGSLTTLGWRFPEPGDTPAANGPNLRPPALTKERRHQIPGLRRTPYVKVLLVRCDDNDAYKATRAQIREWIKEHTLPPGRKATSTAENHDAFEWMIIHVVIPNTAASFQPRVLGGKASDSSTDLTARQSTTTRWRPGTNTILEKMRSDFNTTSKGGIEDRVAQVRIGINDLPYDMLPRVVPAVPTGYTETDQDAEMAWADVIGKFKTLILSSFNMRVSQYEEDIKEKDAQRSLPGWNFCTFFILKEGLARAFESVGLVEDALRGYDELSVGLDTVLEEQMTSGSAEAHGGVLLSYTDELKELVDQAASQIEDEESLNLQSGARLVTDAEEIPISSSRKPYRDLILANNVSVFDFRCYIFARQISLLSRLGNAWSTRDELLAKLKEQQHLVLKGVAPRLPQQKTRPDDQENLTMLSDICSRALKFIPAIMLAMRQDILTALRPMKAGKKADGAPPSLDSIMSEVLDNVVASFAFSVAQQILAQTSTKALPIPPSLLSPPDGTADESKVTIPEPKTMMHPARNSSLRSSQPSDTPALEKPTGGFLKSGLEELAAQRAELYAMTRSILEEAGKKRGWRNGWESVPIVGDAGMVDLVDISLDDGPRSEPSPRPNLKPSILMAGIENELLCAALDTKEAFYRLYEMLTDKTLRHYAVAAHQHSVKACMADLAVLKYHLGEHDAAAQYFYKSTPFFGDSGWSLLELSMLIVYSRCLKELNRKDQYVGVVRKLLSQAAAAERDRTAAKSLFGEKKAVYPDASAVSGFLDEFLAASESVEKNVKMPMANFFSEMAIDGPPAYEEGQDGFAVTLKFRGLVPDHFEAQKASMRIVCPAAGGSREIWLQSLAPMMIKTGWNRIRLHSNVFMAGIYEVDQIQLSSHNVLFHMERHVSQPADAKVLKARIALYQRARSLDVRLLASRQVQLHKNSTVDILVQSGWNSITRCEVKIKPGMGGLRLLTHEAVVVGPHQPTKKPEGGLFVFGPVPAESTITIRLPFTVEQDQLSVLVKVDVSYSTDRGSFSFFKAPSVPVALMLGVNVQDLFKHDALLSRFTVSTVTQSPLRLYRSNLLSSDMFESQFGVPPSRPVMIFPKQSAVLLYKTVRKPTAKLTRETKKTLYLELHYSILTDEIEAAFEESLRTALKDTPLWEHSKLVVSHVVGTLQNSLTGYDLEKTMLLGEQDTSFLGDVKWEREFRDLGACDGDSTASKLAGFIRDWQRKHPKLRLTPSDSTAATDGTDALMRSIIIPVDVPPITVLHTADIQFQPPVDMMDMADPDSGTPAVCINQLLPATLHLKWTRIWDTGDVAAAVPSTPTPSTPTTITAPASYLAEDMEFSYEVTAPPDTWLLGGRRKGHFVIPGIASPSSSELALLSSTPDTEADIPLLLIPLREGWLPLPTVDVREVKTGHTGAGVDANEDIAATGLHGLCETDYRNHGETVRVVGDRMRVTVSLDASGPGGGPLVLECEGAGRVGRVVV